MSRQGFQLTYNRSLVSLEKILDAVKRSGDYCCSGTHETPMPKIVVEGVGVLSFPIPADQSRRVIEVAAEKAPYGRGAETLVDEKVRKVWQISPERLEITGKGWERSFKELVGDVAEGLGCEEGSVVAELYKMLVYDEGGHFAPHRDTEKSPGMFGTLVVTLPASHEGGDLVIRHREQETVLSLCGDEPGEVRYAAFYADCEHEVRPVTKGYRVCLVYNLIATASGASVMAPDNQSAVQAVARVLRDWGASGAAPQKLVYLLEHHYTQAAISWAGLKNSDAARASVLHAAAAQAGCAIYVGMVHIEEYGQADYNQSFDSRYDYDDGGDDESNYEVGEVDNGDYYIDQWRDPEDTSVAFGEVPLKNEEILPTGSLDGEESDDVHFTEATGNAGMSFERTYLRAALVIWPEIRFDDICISSGIDGALVRLEKLVDDVQASTSEAVAVAWKAAGEFAAKLLASWQDHDAQASRLAALLQQLVRLADREVLWTAVQKIPLNKGYDSSLNPVLIACAGVLSLEQMQSVLRPLFEDARAERFADLLQLWLELARVLPAHAELLEVALAALTKAAEPEDAAPVKPSPLLSAYAFDRQFAELRAAQQTYRAQGRSHLKLTPTLLAEFLSAASVAVGSGPACRFVNAITSNPKAFKPDSLLLPCLEQLSKRETAGDVVVSHLWRQFASALLRRSGSPPAEPKDWAQSDKITGADKFTHLKELQAFARDPESTTHRFKARQDIRSQIERAIEAQRLDMVHVTERKGTPQTLVVTKTRTRYEAARQQYENDCQQMTRLLKLPLAEEAESEEITNGLRKALG